MRKRGVEAAHSSILERREEKEASDEATEVFEKFHPAFSGDRSQELLTIDFLRKYIKFCKNRTPPVLSQEASDEIAEKYVNMRLRFQQTFVEGGKDEKRGKLAVTTRTLEALIRLSTAHAKLKLRGGATAEEQGFVTVDDVKVAADLLLQAREEPISSQPAAEADDIDIDADGSPPGDDDDDDGNAPDQRRRRRRKRRRTSRTGDSTEAGDTMPDSGDDGITPQRLEVFRTLLSKCFRRTQQQSEDTLLQQLNQQLEEGETPFTSGEFQAGLMLLEAQNKIMRASGTVYIV